MNKTSQRLLAVGLPLATIAATGIAFAAWTATGSGSGAAKAGNATNSLVVTNATSTTALVPGGTVAISYTVTRTTNYAVAWTTVAADTAAITSDTAGCGAADVIFHSASVTQGLAKGVLTGDFTAPGVLEMKDTADNSCQNALFTVPIKLS